MAIQVRHELKYYISEKQHFLLASMLKNLLWIDKNADPETGEYIIRSLYFDTIFNDALYDKVSGESQRDKYRIRIYNFSDKVVNLECKSKYDNYISKRSVSINRDIAEQIMAGDFSGLYYSPSGLLRDVAREMNLKLLRPAVIVDYVREAYVHPAEDIRITFDKRLRSGLFSHDLFNPELPTIPVIDNQTILEVKFNGILPPYIKQVLSLAAGWSTRSAISKYCLCRMYENKDY